MLSDLSFWNKESRRKDGEVYRSIAMVMHEFGLSPTEVYGGTARITGRIGDSEVDLKLEYDGMDSLLAKDLFDFLKWKSEEQKKASKSKR